MEFDDSVSTAQAQAAGLGSPSFASFGDDASYAKQSAGSSGGSDSNFTIGIDPNRISDNMFTNYVNAGTNAVPNVFDLGGGVGDFGFGTAQSPYVTIGNQFSSGGPKNVPTFLNPTLAEMYKQQEIARTGVNLDKNPYVDSIFTKLFGDTIDRRTDLGEKRIQEINDLRARQAFGLPSLTQKLADGKTPAPYTSKDFEVGRDTQQGIVTALPKNMFQSFLENAPLIGPAINLLGNTRSAPLQSQMYRDAQAEANAPGIMSMTGDFLTDIAKTAESIFSGIFSGKPVGEPFDEVNPNYDVSRVNDFNQFSPNSSRTYEATDRDFTPITNVSISKENVMNPYEDNLGMTLKGDTFRDSRGLPLSDSRMSTDVNEMLEAEDFKKELTNLTEDERNFLSGRTDTIKNRLNY